MKRISHKTGTLHIETPLGIINITVGLRDAKGRTVEAIGISPWGTERGAERNVRRIGDRLVQNAHPSRKPRG